MTQLYHPLQRMQNDGHWLGWKNCTCTAAAVCEDVNTQGQVKLTGGDVREATHDFEEGTTPDQVDKALREITNKDQLSTGYFTPKEIRSGLREGKTFLACVRYSIVRDYGARQRAAGVLQRDFVAGSELFGGWHAIALHMQLAPGETVTIRCQVKAGPTRKIIDKKLKQPADAPFAATVVYDPLNDGRRSTVAKGVVLYGKDLMDDVFAGSKLWRGKIYGGFTLPAVIPEAQQEGQAPPPPPEVHLRRGAKLATSAFRGPWTVERPSFLRSSPRKNRNDPTANVVRSVPIGHLFRCRQTTRGTLIKGSRRWLGNMTGDLWLHESRARKGQ